MLKITLKHNTLRLFFSQFLYRSMKLAILYHIGKMDFPLFVNYILCILYIDILSTKIEYYLAV